MAGAGGENRNAHAVAAQGQALLTPGKVCWYGFAGLPSLGAAADRHVCVLELPGRKKRLRYSLSLLRKEKKTPNKSKKPHKKSNGQVV